MVKKAKFKSSPKKKKLPRHSSEIRKNKVPGYSPENSPDSILNLKPSWRFGLMDITGQWGWGNVESKAKLLKITDKLKAFETMTWGEIGKRGDSHSMPKDRITRNAQKNLSGKRIDADELETLHSLRLSSTERVWGIREREVFYILWWDPEHSVYPVEPRNT